MDFDTMTREELIAYLESWGYACHDHETEDDLREAARLNYELEGS